MLAEIDMPYLNTHAPQPERILDEAATSSTTGSSSTWSLQVSLQVALSIFSFLASLSLAIRILKMKKYVRVVEMKYYNRRRKKIKKKKKLGGLSNPYRRILFLLCLADMFYVISLALGPFLATPEYPLAKWAVGSYETCQWVGFLLGFGFLLSNMYFAFLCFYYLCKLCLKMKDDEFLSRFERKMHTLIIGVATIGTICSAVLDTIHTAPTGVMCAPATNFPTGCSQKPDLYGECDSSIQKNARNIALLSFCIVGFSFLTVLVIAIVMIKVAIQKSVLYRNISKTDPSMKRQESESKDEDQDEEAERREEGNLTNLRNQGLDRYEPIVEQNGDFEDEEKVEGLPKSSDHVLLDASDENSKCSKKKIANDKETSEKSMKLLQNIVKLSSRSKSSSIQLEDEKSEKKTVSVDKSSFEINNEESACIVGVVPEIDRIQEREKQKQDAEELRKLYVKVISTQALLWIAANVIILGPFLGISYLMLQKNIAPEDLPLILRFSNSIIYPLKGVIHILIFTRPAVMFFRQIRKDHNWIRSFYLIVKAGGEVPPLRVFQFDERFDHLEGSIPNDPDVVPVQPCAKIESVPFGVENVVSSMNPSIMGKSKSPEDLEYLLNEVKEASYANDFNGSKSQMSSNNILYHSERDWYHIQGKDEYPRDEYPSHYALSFDENGHDNIDSSRELKDNLFSSSIS
ncbi:predicted protein [Chaetoceros tenuissimus]|uniref:Uncharacterized protein n=1 Tax=Chaetoceros tenuissimus TaxID=426638 RepID=A0AAD3D2C2_9STRA|nr:predicted protein [Chaetoceros tenuissimus]